MDKRTQASRNQDAAYQREAADRITAFSAAAVASALVGVGAAAIITAFFPHAGGDTRDRIFGYSFFAVFAIVCSIAVYEIDKVFTRKFNQNP